MSRKLLSVAALVTLGLNACSEERANINEPDYPNAYGFSLAPAAARSSNWRSEFSWVSR
jgi:hypothetical protein